MAKETSKRTTQKTSVSTNTQIKKISNKEEDKPSFYLCCSCKKHFKKLDGDFPASQSELYAGLDYHLPICKTCLDKLFMHYTEVYGNDEDKAIRRICMTFDIYYNKSLLNASRKITKDRSRIHTYISRANLLQYKDKTYDTTLDEENNNIITDEQLSDMNAKELKKLNNNRKIWGNDYSAEEYDLLNNHYSMLTKQIDSIDFVQETLIRDLCDIKIQQIRARKANDLDKYEKLIKLYQSTLSNAKLKPNNGSTIDDVNDCYGSWLNDIEQFTPAEFYKDKTKYRDFFGLKEYVERFMYRPLKNLITGSREMDDEFSIKNENDGDING